MSPVACMNESRHVTNYQHAGAVDVCGSDYGVRLRLVGSIKLQVSFAKEPYKRDYILQKRPII